MKRKPKIKNPPGKFPGPVAPLLWSIIGTAFTILILLLFKIISQIFYLPMIRAVMDYCLGNLPSIFIISLLISYTEFFLKFKRTIAIIAPLTESIAGVITLIFIFGLLDVLNIYLKIGVLSLISTLVKTNIFLLFVIFLFFGYLKYIINLIKAIIKS